MDLLNMSDDLLTRFLLDETSPEEQKRVEEWIAENDQNARYFEQLKLIWQRSKNLTLTSKVNEDEAWMRFKEKINSRQSKVKPIQSFAAWLKIAASIMLFCGLGWYAYDQFIQYNRQSQVLVNINSYNQTQTDTLPDGSVITLNKYTRVSYRGKLQDKVRELKLDSGEAFFQVKHDDNKPFIVQVDDVEVRVLGTSFNIKKQDGKVEVIVETGQVQVSKHQVLVKLKPKEKVEIKPGDNSFEKQSNTDELYNYYRTKKFIVDGTPLYRLVEVLNEVYGAHISIGDKRIRNLPLHTTLNENSLDDVLDVISKTFNIQVIREKNGSIVLR